MANCLRSLRLLLLTSLCLPGLCGAQMITPDARIGPATGWQSEPSVALAGSRAVAVWQVHGGAILASWATSTDGGATWETGVPLTVIDPVRHRIAGLPRVCADGAGQFSLAVLYQDFGQYTVAVYRSSEQGGGLVWQGPTLAVPIVGESNISPEYDALQLTCDPDRGYLYLTCTRQHWVATGQYETTVQIVRSLDGGQSWSVPLTLSSTKSNGSQPAVGPDGEVYVMWEDYALRQVLGRKSTDFGATFGAPFVVAAIQDNLGHPPPVLEELTGRVNAVYPWSSRLGPDFPSLAIDRTQGPSRGRIYATWTDYADGAVGGATGYEGDIEPNDHYVNAVPIEIGDDFGGYMQSADFGGPDCDNYTFVGTAGTTLWLNGQVTQTFPTSNQNPVRLGCELTCGGDTTALVLIGVMEVVEARGGPVPPLIYTLPASGRYYLQLSCPGFYSTGYALSLRALSPAPGQAAQDHRDVVLVSSGDGGVTWSAKQRVNDSPPRFDDALPKVAVDGQGRVHVAWYDRRDDPDCGDRVHTYWTYSSDGGTSFVPSRRLSSASGPWQEFQSPSSNIGDHLGLAAEGNRVHVLWTDTRGADADIYGTVITDVVVGIAVPRFEAEASGSGVTLSWTVAQAAGITGFRVHRGEGTSEVYVPLGAGPRAPAGVGEYQEEDASAAPGHRYRYRLEVLRGSEPSEWQGPVAVSVPAAIGRLAWRRIAPNPSAGPVLLELAVPRRGAVAARVYDLAGKEVVILYQGGLEAGVVPLTWDGRGPTGRPVAAGVYLVRAELGAERVTARIARIE